MSARPTIPVSSVSPSCWTGTAYCGESTSAGGDSAPPGRGGNTAEAASDEDSSRSNSTSGGADDGRGLLVSQLGTHEPSHLPSPGSSDIAPGKGSVSIDFAAEE